MNGTPRLRSAYPSTPNSDQKRIERNGPYPGPQKLRPPLPTVEPNSTYVSKPLISFSVIDAPSQRLYVLIFYACLSVWRVSDYLGLVSDEAESLWLFMKWLAIDSVFLYGLPEFQIPWLQWSSSTTAFLVVLHTFLNAFLMFRIPVCQPPSARYKMLSSLTCRYLLPPGFSHLPSSSTTESWRFRNAASSQHLSSIIPH